ncbi:hypothetical protein [Nostoc sp.]
MASSIELRIGAIPNKCDRISLIGNTGISVEEENNARESQSTARI